MALLAAAQGGEDVLARAVALHEAAITIDRKLGDKRGLAVELDHLAAVLRRKGDLQAAYGCVAETLDLWLELGDPVDLAFWLDAAWADGQSLGRERMVEDVRRILADRLPAKS